MAAELLSFFRPAKPVNGDWSTQEIAEFYRVEAALVQAGASIVVDRGISDEGDPWFVFCRSNDGEVIVHFARIGGKYLIVAGSVGHPLLGVDFRQLLTDFVKLNPALILIPRYRGAKLMLHPASLLAAVVATALYHMSGPEAVASALDPNAVDRSHLKSGELETPHGPGQNSFDLRQIAAAVAAIGILAAIDYSSQAQDNAADLATKVLDPSEDHTGQTHIAIAEPTTASDAPSLAHLQVASQEVRTWLDSISQLATDQTLLQQLQFDVTSNPLPKWPAPTTADAPLNAESAHWWDFLSYRADTNPRYFAWADVTTGLGSFIGVSSDGQNLTAPQIALQTISQATPGANKMGSPPSDLPALQASDFQAASFVNLQLSSSDHIISKFNLNGTLSFQDVVNFAASEVFGSASPALFQLNVSSEHFIAATSQNSGSMSPVSSAQPAGTLPTQSLPEEVATSALAPYQPPPFTAAASAIVSAFMQQNSVDEVVSNRDVVLIDTNTSHLSSPDFVFKTWSMADGSTITIIGLLPHNLALVA